ncbi:MAG: hypothetical protein IPG96_00160 [Proteobacteria bacterium]|nr:hypothetical protein [Pseudomonadota bacterium]
MTDRRDLSAFARAVEALEPYLKDLVFVGGWAHYLYTLRPEAGPVPFEPLRTEDADVAAPARLARGKEGIPELLTKAGFREHLSSDHTPPISEYVLGDDAGGFYLEFLAPLVGGEVKRGGRPDVTTTVGGVTAQTLRYLDILLTEPWQVTLTRDAGFPVARQRVISIPNPAAYVVQKMLVLPKRRPEKQGKDLLYVHDTFALLADSLPAVQGSPSGVREEAAREGGLHADEPRRRRSGDGAPPLAWRHQRARPDGASSGLQATRRLLPREWTAATPRDADHRAAASPGPRIAGRIPRHAPRRGDRAGG